MDKVLNVLCLEDSPRDAELIRELLVDSGYKLNMDCAAFEKEFVSFLKNGCYDIIVSDFKLPGFDAFAALKWSVDSTSRLRFSLGGESDARPPKQWLSRRENTSTWS